MKLYLFAANSFMFNQTINFGAGGQQRQLGRVTASAAAPRRMSLPPVERMAGQLYAKESPKRHNGIEIPVCGNRLSQLPVVNQSGPHSASFSTLQLGDLGCNFIDNALPDRALSLDFINTLLPLGLNQQVNLIPRASGSALSVRCRRII